MIQSLSRKLHLLFAGSTSLILTVLLCIAFLYQDNQLDSRTGSSFQSRLLDIRSRLELESKISDHWLSQMEGDGGLIIHIEDNGRPLSFRGAWEPRTDRETLIARAKGKALLEHVDTSQAPVSYTSRESSVFPMKGDHGDTYLGCVVVLARDSFRTLTLLQDTTDLTMARRWQRVLFLGLELLGVLSLWLVSRKVVGRAVKPVEEYHRRQTEFVAAASHELRSPLAVIQTCASAITAVPEQSEHMAEVIQRECARTGKLVKGLLQLASLDAGEDKDAGEETAEADQVLLELLEAYEPLCHAQGIRLCLQLPEEPLPIVRGSEKWLYQILAVLVDNAMAYGCPEDSGGKKEILLKAEQQGKRVVLLVQDYGPGIPDIWKERIFERFSRMDASRRDKEHFGLGLSLAASLAMQMGIELEAADTEGGGSTFRVRILAAKEPPGES